MEEAARIYLINAGFFPSCPLHRDLLATSGQGKINSVAIEKEFPGHIILGSP